MMLESNQSGSAIAGPGDDGKKKERYFTIMSPLFDSSKKSSGLFSSAGRDGAAAKAASSLYSNHFKQKGVKVFVLYMARNANKDVQYPYLAVIKDVNKQIKKVGAASPIVITHERKVYSLCRTKMHTDVHSIVRGETRDAKGGALPQATQAVRDEIRSIINKHEQKRKNEVARAEARKQTRATKSR